MTVIKNQMKVLHGIFNTTPMPRLNTTAKLRSQLNGYIEQLEMIRSFVAYGNDLSDDDSSNRASRASQGSNDSLNDLPPANYVHAGAVGANDDIIYKSDDKKALFDAIVALEANLKIIAVVVDRQPGAASNAPVLAAVAATVDDMYAAGDYDATIARLRAIMNHEDFKYSGPCSANCCCTSCSPLASCFSKSGDDDGRYRKMSDDNGGQSAMAGDGSRRSSARGSRGSDSVMEVGGYESPKKASENPLVRGLRRLANNRLVQGLTAAAAIASVYSWKKTSDIPAIRQQEEQRGEEIGVANTRKNISDLGPNLAARFEAVKAPYETKAAEAAGNKKHLRRAGGRPVVGGIPGDHSDEAVAAGLTALAANATQWQVDKSMEKGGTPFNATRYTASVPSAADRVASGEILKRILAVETAATNAANTQTCKDAQTVVPKLNCSTNDPKLGSEIATKGAESAGDVYNTAANKTAKRLGGDITPAQTATPGELMDAVAKAAGANASAIDLTAAQAGCPAAENSTSIVNASKACATEATTATTAGDLAAAQAGCPAAENSTSIVNASKACADEAKTAATTATTAGDLAAAVTACPNTGPAGAQNVSDAVKACATAEATAAADKVTNGVCAALDQPVACDAEAAATAVETQNGQLTTKNAKLTTDNTQLTTDNTQLTTDNTQLKAANTQLTQQVATADAATAAAIAAGGGVNVAGILETGTIMEVDLPGQCDTVTPPGKHDATAGKVTFVRPQSTGTSFSLGGCAVPGVDKDMNFKGTMFNAQKSSGSEDSNHVAAEHRLSNGV